MAHARRTAIMFVVAAAVMATLELALPPTASATGRAFPLTHARSARPATTAVVGRTANYVVYNDVSNGVAYLANPGGRAAPKLLARGARATAVAGELVEYLAGGVRLWRNLTTGQHGSVPATWTFLAPDGGMRVRQNAGHSTLEYLHVNGSTQSFALPDALPSSGAMYSVVAGADGVAVAAGTPAGRAEVAYSTLTGSAKFILLKTDGVPRGPLTCPSLSAASVGCLTTGSVVRLATDGVGLAQVSTPAAHPLGVAVTDGYTSWTAPRTAEATRCPCNMASIDITGTAVSIVSGLTSGAITAGRGRFFYSSGTARPKAGVHVDLFAGAGDLVIARAGGRPLRASAPTLGTGRAAWADDSARRGAVWTARLRPDSTGAAARRRAVGASWAPVGISGPRTVYSGAGRALRLVYGTADQVVAYGTIVNLSGSQLLFRGTHHHLVLRDLAHGGRIDVTRSHAAIAAALSGRYLSFLRADGSVWRQDTDRPRRAAVRLAAAAPHGAAAGHVYSWGNWTAWTFRPRGGGARVSAWRNAVTLTPARRLDAARRLYGASIGGAVVGNTHSARFALVSWTSGAVRTSLPGTGAAPSVDGNTVGWRRDGIPSVASLGLAIRNQPRALGNVFAPRHVTGGAVWRLELPTSAPLTRCSVTFRHGNFHGTVRCGQAWQRSGDVLVRWPTRSAPSGRYRWTVHAAGADGPLLGTSGGTTLITGTVTIS